MNRREFLKALGAVPLVLLVPSWLQRSWAAANSANRSDRGTWQKTLLLLELHGGNGVMLDFGVEKIFRDAAIFLHMDATADISKFKIVKALFPDTAGKYAGPE